MGALVFVVAADATGQSEPFPVVAFIVCAAIAFISIPVSVRLWRGRPIGSRMSRRDPDGPGSWLAPVPVYTVAANLLVIDGALWLVAEQLSGVATVILDVLFVVVALCTLAVAAVGLCIYFFEGPKRLIPPHLRGDRR